MKLSLICLQLFITFSFIANATPPDQVFLSATIQWCENKEDGPWCSQRDAECKMTPSSTVIESVCTYKFINNNSSLEDDSWTIIVYGPEFNWDSDVDYPAGDYFFYLGKTKLSNGKIFYSASWNGNKESTKAQWLLGENFSLVEGYPDNGQVGNTGRYTMQNPNATFVLDFSIPKILSDIEFKKEFTYSDLADYLSKSYTNADYTIDLSYLSKVLDDKIRELLNARLAANAMWIEQDKDYGPDWAELNKLILKTQREWQAYANALFEEEYWGGGSGASARGSRRYIQKQIDRINELKVILK
jgi:hypothetical protein